MDTLEVLHDRYVVSLDHVLTNPTSEKIHRQLIIVSFVNKILEFKKKNGALRSDRRSASTLL